MSKFKYQSWFNPSGYYNGKQLHYSEGWLIAQIFFSTNFSMIDIKDLKILNEIYQAYHLLMLGSISTVFKIVGNADYTGRKRYNKKLGMERAINVKQHLDQQFKMFSSYKSIPSSHGELFAIVTNRRQKQAEDRRVDIFAPYNIKQKIYLPAITVKSNLKFVDELMIYDADDNISINEAKEFLNSNKNVSIEGIKGVYELSNILKKYRNLKQINISTHGSPGNAYFKNGSLNNASLSNVAIPGNLFQGVGRLLFLGCEIARGKKGEDFLIAVGKHFFNGKKGIVAGSTISTLGFSSGTRLPLMLWIIGDFTIGELIIFLLDTKGNVIKRLAKKSFGL